MSSKRRLDWDLVAVAYGLLLGALGVALLWGLYWLWVLTALLPGDLWRWRG